MAPVIDSYISFFPAKKRKRRSDLWLNRPKKIRIAEKDDEKKLTPCSSTSIPCIRSELKNAPIKLKRKKSKIKRKLYKESVEEKIIDDMTVILPSILNKMKNVGLLGDFVNLFKLLHEDKFPLNNIAFLLFLDVVRWYSLENTVNMEYSEEAIKFWRVMYRLFHGKALRFMGGLRTEQNEGSRGGGYNPGTSSINFAVPSQRRVTATDTLGINLPKELPPGIFIDNSLK